MHTNIVICSESKERVEEKLERWRYALERRGMKVNRRKTEYKCVNERKDNGRNGCLLSVVCFQW